MFFFLRQEFKRNTPTRGKIVSCAPQMITNREPVECLGSSIISEKTRDLSFLVYCKL